MNDLPNNHHPAPVSDQQLHAYVDDELDATQRLRVEAWIAAHPNDAARVRDYRAIGQRLHQRFDALLTEDAAPPAITTHAVTHRRRQRPAPALNLARAAMMAGLMLASGLLGWSLHGDGTAPTVAQADLKTKLIGPAMFAHRIYTADTRYPVEIPAVERASLDHWVSQRMHTKLRAPDLSGHGLSLVGGRLLPSTNRMAAQFMYEDGSGQRLTVYVRRIAEPGADGDFQYRERDGLNLFYWLDADMGYAVVGPQPAATLIAIARTIKTALGSPVTSPMS